MRHTPNPRHKYIDYYTLNSYKLVLHHQLIINHFTYQFTAPGNNAKEEGLTSFCPLQPCPQLNHLLTSYTNLMVCSSTNLRVSFDAGLFVSINGYS